MGTLGLALLAFGGVKTFQYFKPDSKSSYVKQKPLPVSDQKPFVIVIPSYNNSCYVEKNLRSVFEQNYRNFRVIYIDDCSTDDTYEKVRAYVAQHKLDARVTLIHNDKNQGALSNYYRAIHTCKNYEIVVSLDGDDFLAHDNVLVKLNQLYSTNDVWMTYGNYLDYPTYKRKVVTCKKIPDSVIRHNNFRKYQWVSSHLRSFYAGLFKQIKLEDLLYKGRFFPMGGDLAMMFPLLEMAGKHALFIHDILYLYNRTNPLNDHKTNFALQQECAEFIRKQRAYARLKELSLRDKVEKSEKADLVVFSFDRPMQLFALLESIELYMKGVQRIHVLYRTSTPSYAESYEQVSRAFPQVNFVQQSETPHEDFKPLFCQIALDKSSPYLLISVDDVILKDNVDLTECIKALEKTRAYGFYFSHSKSLDYCYMRSTKQEIPPHVFVGHDIFAWQFKDGHADWKDPNSVDFVLYRKEEIAQDLAELPFYNPNTLEAGWTKKKKARSIGLFYSCSKCVNVPLNLVNISTNRYAYSYSPSELLKKFKEGYKIDITPLFQVDSSSKHMEWEPTFVKR